MQYLTEVSPPSSSKTKGNDEELAMEISEQSSEPVFYLRDARFYLLYPENFNNYRLWTPMQDSPFRFLWKMRRDLVDQMVRMTPQLKDEISLMEIRRHLVNRRKDDLAKSIKSLEDVPSYFLSTLRDENWYYNQTVNHDTTDEYQLLCLGNPLMTNWEYAVPNIYQLNNVGNSLQADLQYKEFSDRVFKDLEWGDTEEQGAEKAIAIRDEYFPTMKDRVFPWLLGEWTLYIADVYAYWKKIDMHCKLWVRVEEKQEPISDVLSELIDVNSHEHKKSEFAKIKKFIEKRRRKGPYRRADSLIMRYFQIATGGPKRITGGYLLYVKEKIRMALKLGIIRKEDVIESEAGSELLKDIEQYDPHYF